MLSLKIFHTRSSIFALESEKKDESTNYMLRVLVDRIILEQSSAKNNEKSCVKISKQSQNTSVETIRKLLRQ